MICVGQSKMRWILPGLPIACLILGALPNSVVMHFDRSPEYGGSFESFYSYLSLMPLGYGNLGPMLTMALCVVLAVMCIWNAFRPDVVRQRYTALVALVALAASCMNLLFREMTGIGYTISAMLLILLSIQIVINHK